MHISDEQVKHWIDHGYVVVADFLGGEDLAGAQHSLYSTFPTTEEYVAYPAAYQNDARGGHMRESPYLSDELNDIACHPEIISFVERALGTPEIMLSQSIVWAKYPIAQDFEQPLHADYMNTSLLYPIIRGGSEEVTFIIYYVDIDQELGPTYVVSKQQSQDELLVPYTYPRDTRPDVYRCERPICVSAGSLLAYSMGTLHRASHITSRSRIRFTHHLVYRAAAAQWVGYRVWANYGLSAEMQAWIERMSPRQRMLLGFPAPGHEYWGEETLRGIAARYPRMDMEPYVAAATLPEPRKAALRESWRSPRSSKTGVTSAAENLREAMEQAASEESALESAYLKGIADYCAVMSGVPANYWRAWLSAYTGAPRR